MSDATVSYPHKLTVALSDRARIARARARRLKDAITASPFSIREVAEEAAMDSPSGAVYARNVLNERVTAAPTVQKLEAAFLRLSSAPAAPTGEAR